MSFTDSIPPIDPSKRVQRIDDHQQEREKRPVEPSPSSLRALLALSYFICKKISSFFPYSSSQENISHIKESLKNLQKDLQTLTSQQLSQNTPFLSDLSSCWNNFLDSFVPFSLIQNPFIFKTQSFIDELQHYPKNAEYSLGYYLSEFAGEKWIPYPYMEMLQKLYELFQENPADNPLQKWISDIDELLLLN
jgi:hypothetical protein